MAITGPRVVKAALATLFAADAAFNGVTIYTYTVDLGSVKTREWLVLGNVAGTVEHYAAGGSKQLTKYDIEGSFSIHQPAPNDSADRAWALLETMMSVVGPNWTVSGNTLNTYFADYTIDETIHPDGGRRVDVEFTIKVEDTSG